MTSEEFLKVKLGENNFTDTTGIKVRVVERLLTEFAQIHVNAAEKTKRMYNEEDIISLLDFVNDTIPDLYSRFNSRELLNKWLE